MYNIITCLNCSGEAEYTTANNYNDVLIQCDCGYEELR